MQSVCLLVFVCMLHVVVHCAYYLIYIRFRTWYFFCTPAQHDEDAYRCRETTERASIKSGVRHMYVWLHTKKQIPTPTPTAVCMPLN